MAQTKPMQSETEILEQIRELVSKCLKSNRKDLNLRELLKLSNESFYQRMKDSGCVSENTKENVCYDDIMQQYIAGLACQKTIEELEDYLNKFLCVLEKLEGPIAKVGEVLRIALNTSVCDDFPEVKFLNVPPIKKPVTDSEHQLVVGQALLPETLGQVNRPSDSSLAIVSCRETNSSPYPLQQAVPVTGNSSRSMIAGIYKRSNSQSFTERDDPDSGKGQTMFSEVKDTELKQEHLDTEVGREDQDSDKEHTHNDSEIDSQEKTVSTTHNCNKLQGSECETHQPQSTTQLFGINRRKTGSTLPTNTTVYTSGTPQGKCTEQHQEPTTDLNPAKPTANKYFSPKRCSLVSIGDINLHCCPPMERSYLCLGLSTILVIFIFINIYIIKNMCGI